MKRLFLIFFLATPFLAIGQLWTEDFTGEANGATTGTAGGTIGGTWSVTTTPAGTFSKQTLVGFPLFQVSSTITEGVWQSAVFSIAGTGRATIDATIAGLFVGAGDYIRCYYRVDGGAETLFYEQLGGGLSFTGVASAIVTGSTLQLVIRSSNDGSFIGLDTYTVDDIIVSAVNTLYSRKSGNWNDATVGNATWSIVGLGGISCDCTPLVTDYVIVGNTNTVNINVAATAGGVEVRNTGTLRWTVSNIDLNIDRGILQVDLGGTINRNAQTNVQIDFDRGVISTFIVNGSITAEDIEITAADATINLSGAGSINLTDDFLVTQNNDIVNNNLNGTFSIGDDLIFSQDVSQFVNSRTLTVVSDISAAANTDDDNVVTNSSGAILNVSGFNPNDADFDLLNSGTVNQSGNFSNINTADTNFANLAGGIWNWTLTPNTTFDTDMSTELNCTADGNLFTYSGAGAQRIIPTSYDDLTLSVSGAKDSNGAAIFVAGNWVVSGTASFTEGAGTVTFNGTTGNQSITNASGETFNNLVINNSFGTIPQITTNNAVTVTGALTMTSGVVNLAGTTFTLGSSGVASDLNRTASTTTNWMYGGSFRRFWPTGQAPSPTAGNLYGLFPLGNSTASSYRPVQITASSNVTTTGSVTFTHVNASTSTDLSPLYDDDPTAGVINIVRKNDSQFIGSTSLIAGGTNYTIVITMTNLLAGTASDIRLAVSNGATTVTNVGSHVANTGTAPIPVVGRSGLTVANLTGDFRITTINSAATPLPIELTSFDASLIRDQVNLTWVTASELNNDFFTIERASDIEKFDKVSIVKGQGTIKSKTNYSFIDESPLPGTSYYRLKQTDFDGKFTYSELRKIEYTLSSTRLNVYPNPIVDNKFSVELIGLQPGEVAPLRVVNLQGASIHNSSFKADASGKILTTIELDRAPSGLYLVIVNVSTGLRKKIIIP